MPEIQLADWERVLRVNLTAPFLLTREVLPHMIARRQGRIVNIASTSSTQGYLHQSAYCASKHGLLGFGRSLAMEAKPHNVHVHTLCPGGVDTDLIKGTYLGERLKGQPMINPEDIAEMVLFLLRQPDNIDLAEVVVRRFDPNLKQPREEFGCGDAHPWTEAGCRKRRNTPPLQAPAAAEKLERPPPRRVSLAPQVRLKAVHA